jgi:hypothetical protein
MGVVVHGRLGKFSLEMLITLRDADWARVRIEFAALDKNVPTGGNRGAQVGLALGMREK